MFVHVIELPQIFDVGLSLHITSAHGALEVLTFSISMQILSAGSQRIHNCQGLSFDFFHLLLQYVTANIIDNISLF